MKNVIKINFESESRSVRHKKHVAQVYYANSDKITETCPIQLANYLAHVTVDPDYNYRSDCDCV